MLNKKDLSEVLNSIDMTDYLDYMGVAYKRTYGSNGMQLNVKTCPVCNDSRYKVYLNERTGLGNCFVGSCEAKFNKFSFIRALTDLSGNALNDHIREFGLSVGWKPIRKSVAVKNENDVLVLPPSFEIPIDGKNLQYLSNRNISIETAQYFHLRYCHDQFWVAKDRIADFSRRIIIPIYDLEGNLVSFQGRDITGKSEKKYLFPSGFASTGKYIYNGQNVVNCSHIVLGEGVFDVFSIKDALDSDKELRDVVATGSFGKHLSEAQISELIKLKDRGLKTVTFMWDGEKDAIKSAVKSALKLKDYGFSTRVALLPNGKDPNEITKDELLSCFYGAKAINKLSAVRDFGLVG